MVFDESVNAGILARFAREELAGYVSIAICPGDLQDYVDVWNELNFYVYEDVNFDGSKHELVNCHYFGGDYAGTEGTKALWQEVFAFVAESYDEEVLEKIYINGDGADWIRTGAGMHAKARFVLDRFHMHKYIISATSHLKDSACNRE